MNIQAIDCVLSLKNTFLCRISGIPVLTYQYNKCILKKIIFQQSFILSYRVFDYDCIWGSI